MKNIHMIAVGLLALIIAGCASRGDTNDLFGNEVHREKVLLAAENYKDLIGIYKEKLEKQDTPTIRLKLAQYYFESKDYNSVFYYLTPLLQTESNQAMLLWAKSLEATSKYQEALDILEKLIAKDKNIAQAYNLKGIIFAMQKNFPLAKENFLEAKRLFLSDEIINNNLAMVSILEQKYPEAIDYLYPLYMRGYKDTKLLNNLIFALIKANKPEMALQIVQKENLSDSPRNFIRNISKIKRDAL
ncbi:hypothetical protein BKH46_05860 [Helicobacter sp. 12S02634-8]|uniref:CDC27 family protein n=1 Tax=Helicobacter sp. 12S02634-8 TaxID=1476199 RepID=UPI000BA740FA|nr:CDC27 family protein [Helicobacter sp. 12S02634-8]PAF46961.1 hypothetical protein BKH46_05860 [Helicobacter sp. 12S02634-8]